MSKQTIIDWQKDSLLLASGSRRGGKCHLDLASMLRASEEEDGRPVSIEKTLQQACSRYGLKGDVTLVASRDMVEVRTLAIPHMDPDELPDVIRFQAQRQLSNMTDSWALDYVMLPPTAGQEMQTALVGGISQVHLAEMERVCNNAGLQISRIVLRPIEIARYATESGSIPSTGSSMIVCIGGQTADLLILRGGLVLQVRSTKLPSEAQEIAAVLKGEIRRSLMAAAAQLADAPLDGVLLIATSPIAQHLDGVIAEASDASVTHLDPTTFLPADLEDRDGVAGQAAHRLAAVAGALSADQAAKQSLIDFKHPKKRPPKKKNTGRVLLYGGAAAVLLLSGLGWWFTKNRSLDQDIEFYRAQTAEKAEVVAWAQEKVQDFNEVQKFLDASPNWLDELTYISNKIPEAQKVILESPVFTTQPRDGTALIRVPVRANQSSSIGEFEKSLRDEHHVVQGSDPAEIPAAKDGYKWRVVESITIKNRGWNVFGAKVKTASTEDAPTPEVIPTDPPSLSADETTAEPNQEVPSDAANSLATEAAESEPSAAAGEQVDSPAEAVESPAEPVENKAEPADVAVDGGTAAEGSGSNDANPVPQNPTPENPFPAPQTASETPADAGQANEETEAAQAPETAPKT